MLQPGYLAGLLTLRRLRAAALRVAIASREEPRHARPRVDAPIAAFAVAVAVAVVAVDIVDIVEIVNIFRCMCCTVGERVGGWITAEGSEELLRHWHDGLSVMVVAMHIIVRSWCHRQCAVPRA